MNPTVPAQPAGANERSPRSVGRRSLLAWLPWLLLVLAAAGLVAVGQRLLTLETEHRLLQDERQFAELELRSARVRSQAERLLATRQLTDVNRELAAMGDRAGRAEARATELGRRLGDVERQLAARQGDLADVHVRLAQAEAALARQKAGPPEGSPAPAPPDAPPSP